MDHAEKCAQRLFESVIADARMEFRQSQSHGEYDFNLRYSDGRVAAVEVTSSVDQALEETHDAITGKGGHTIETRLCKDGWYIHPLPDARINLLRKNADRYLSDIEEVGIEKFSLRDDHPSVRAIYHDLGVISGSVASWIKPKSIWMSLPGEGGPVSVNTVFEAAECEALENCKKLGAAATPERHLAVYVYCTASAWVPLCDLEPTPTLPNLPNEITDIWVFSESFVQGEFVVWRAGASLNWMKENLVLQV
jgi:hypothetical protein